MWILGREVRNRRKEIKRVSMLGVGGLSVVLVEGSIWFGDRRWCFELAAIMGVGSWAIWGCLVSFIV